MTSAEPGALEAFASLLANLRDAVVTPREIVADAIEAFAGFLSSGVVPQRCLGEHRTRMTLHLLMAPLPSPFS